MRTALVAAVRKDLVRRLSDPLAFLLWLAIPIVTGALMTAIFSSGGPVKPRGVLYVVDEDDSMVSGLVANMFEYGALGEMLEVEKLPHDEARALLDAGEGSALLRIPAGFGDRILKDEPTSLQLVRNPSQRIVPEVVEGALRLLPEAVFYIQQVFGGEIRDVVERFGTRDADRLRSALGLRIGSIVQSIDRYVFPPLFDVQLATNTVPKGSPFVLLLVPGTLMFGLLFVAQGLSEDLWRERELRTLARGAVAPGGPAVQLLGKLLADATLLWLMASLLIAIAMAWHGVGWMRFGALVGFAWTAGLGLLSMMYFFQTLASSRRAAAIFTNVLVFPLAMLGGGFFPLALMPGFLRAIGELTPNGWATSELTSLLTGDVDAGRFWTGIAVMLGMFVFFSLWTHRRVCRQWLRSA